MVLLSLFFAFTGAKAQINPSNIDIVRDKWGVPHIYGKTDAEATYGLAWATCEDDFKTVEEMLLAVKSKLGEVTGKGGAILDFLSFIGNIDDAVNQYYDTSFSEHYKRILESYAAGLNAYATAHPEEILMGNVFPVSAKDIVKECALSNMLLTSVYIDIQKIWQGSIKNYEINYPGGSNAFAFDSSRTTDGKTYLGINSHQPIEGMFSWYEAHLNSEEGMNILGATFPGLPGILVGANPQLGWACTLNHPDMDDVYKLDMNPENHLQYWLDDHWENLTVRKKTIKVKVGPLKARITKTFYWSKYGTTIKNKDGYYAVRFVSNMDIRGPEEIYGLDKATSFSGWRHVLNMDAIPGINLVYADRKDTIFYASAGEFPYRNPKYNWLKVLPGNTSETLWPAKFHPFDEVPQILKPKSGYLINTNNSCFDVTAPADNLQPGKYDRTFGFGTEKNNRSIMAHYLIGQMPRLSYSDFKKVKYNQTFNDSMYDYYLDNIRVLMNLNPVKYPELADAIEVVKSWNHQCNVNNKEVSIISVALDYLIDKISADGANYENNTYPEKEYVTALRVARNHMLKYFGALRVPLGDIQKHVRGNVVLPIGGAPEVLAATISEPYKNGMRKSNVGESYIELVRYSKDTVEIESVNAFGASAKPNSAHYTDQMQMFVDQKLKPMTLDKSVIYKNAGAVYHPAKTREKKKGLDLFSRK
jgi:acyl-homoserine-lactone acylase